MPPYLNNAEDWKSLWPILFITIGLSFLLAILSVNRAQRRNAEIVKECFVVLATFSMLGTVTGYLSAFSREPTLSSVLPAVLSLIGGITVILITKNKDDRITISTSVFLFALTLLIGSGWGATMRNRYEEYKDYEKIRNELIANAVLEDEINAFRKKLSLPPLQYIDTNKKQ
jgi:hypothetical protein